MIADYYNLEPLLMGVHGWLLSFLPQGWRSRWRDWPWGCSSC